MSPEEVRLVASVAAGLAVAGYVLALIVINRRHTAQIDRFRAAYEASVAPYYAALMRCGKNEAGQRPH